MTTARLSPSIVSITWTSRTSPRGVHFVVYTELRTHIQQSLAYVFALKLVDAWQSRSNKSRRSIPNIGAATADRSGVLTLLLRINLVVWNSVMSLVSTTARSPARLRLLSDLNAIRREPPEVRAHVSVMSGVLYSAYWRGAGMQRKSCGRTWDLSMECDYLRAGRYRMGGRAVHIAHALLHELSGESAQYSFRFKHVPS